MTPLCRNCIPWQGGVGGGRMWSVPSPVPPPPKWEWGSPWGLPRYLNDVQSEGVAEHPVQGDALILQDVLGMQGGRSVAPHPRQHHGAMGTCTQHGAVGCAMGPPRGSGTPPRARGPPRHLQTPTRAVLGQDADVWGIGAGANEARQVFVLDVSHLGGSEACVGLCPTAGTPGPPQPHLRASARTGPCASARSACG